MNWESDDPGDYDSWDSGGAGDSWDDGSAADDSAEDFAEDTIACPNCGRSFFDDAPQCPHCGEYVSHDRSFWAGKSPGTIVFYKLVAIVLIIAFLGSGLKLLLDWFGT